MKILTIVAVSAILILFIVLFFARSKKVYEVHLFVRNTRGEMLLIYDQHIGHFVVPNRQVPFDEIPTKVVYTLMNDLFGSSSWDFDYTYHFADKKYDRVRDDIGPIYVYDAVKKNKKKCVLCYALNVFDHEETYHFKKEYPYPEFYTKSEIENMGADIIPPEETQKILQDLLDK